MLRIGFSFLLLLTIMSEYQQNAVYDISGFAKSNKYRRFI